MNSWHPLHNPYVVSKCAYCNGRTSILHPLKFAKEFGQASNLSYYCSSCFIKTEGIVGRLTKILTKE